MALRTRTIEKPTTEGGDARVEEYLDKKGVKWVFRPGVSTEEFDDEKSMANNARAEAIDDKRVEQYAEAMKRGDKFPPLIAAKHTSSANAKLIITDGNHRLQGAILAKRTVDVYDITGCPTELLVMLSFEANVKHGMPTSEAERIVQALWLISEGANIPAAAAAVNLPVKIVKKASERQTADQRFFDCDIPRATVENLHVVVKQRLSQISTDEGFIAMVGLAERAKITSEEILRVVTEINQRRSSAKQVEFIAELEEQYQAAIQATGGGVLGGKRVMTPKAKIGLSMAHVLSLPADIDSIRALYAGPERDEAAKKMRATAKRLNELARALSA